MVEVTRVACMCPNLMQLKHLTTFFHFSLSINNLLLLNVRENSISTADSSTSTDSKLTFAMGIGLPDSLWYCLRTETALKPSLSKNSEMLFSERRGSIFLIYPTTFFSFPSWPMYRLFWTEELFRPIFFCSVP